MPPTLDQLEAFVSSPAYDADTAGMIAACIPALPRLKGERIAPGITRIRGNLCNVHGRYGPCDKALSGKPKKGRQPRKPIKTDQQRAGERDTKRQANIDTVAQQMAANDTGLSPSGSKALTAFAKGQQPDPKMGAQLAQMGMAEQASDGSYRMTPTGRAVVSAMAAGDYQRAVDAVSRGTDTAGKRTERQTVAQARQAAAAKRQQDAAGKRATAQIDRALTQNAKPAKASASGSKKPTAHTEPGAEKPRKAAPAKRPSRSSAPAGPSASGSSPKPKPKPPVAAKPEKAPAKQLDAKLTEAATALSAGADVTDEQITQLITNGLAKLNKDGDPVLTAAGLRATMKSTDGALTIFKDAQGRDRWVAQSSTAYQDRDKEIVSTKALERDCVFADRTGSYGPLRWWHTPGLDLGDCDFNAMHGRVLIESGTFRSPAIAQKVARAAADLEISLGFLHLPTEPDAEGVFHHIRRFERSLVPRGKASNRFTAFTVKETIHMDATKVSALKTLGFSDDDIAGLQARAETAEKSATDQGIAFKAAEPEQLPDVVINGVTYKAFKPIEEATTPVEEDKAMPGSAEEDALDGGADDAMEEAPADDTALTLSGGDISAIAQAVASAMQQSLGPLVSAMDLTNKVGSHMDELKSMMGGYQTKKDAESAETKEQLTALASKVAELTGDQSAVPYRASAAKESVIKTEAELLAAIKQTDPNADPWADIKLGLGLARQ